MKITLKDALPSKGEKKFMVLSLILTGISAIIFNVIAGILVYKKIEPPRLFLWNWTIPFVWFIFGLVIGGTRGIPKSP